MWNFRTLGTQRFCKLSEEINELDSERLWISNSTSRIKKTICNSLKTLKLHDFKPRIPYPAKQFKYKVRRRVQKTYLLCTLPQKPTQGCDKPRESTKDDREDRGNSHFNTGRRSMEHMKFRILQETSGKVKWCSHFE